MEPIACALDKDMSATEPDHTHSEVCYRHPDRAAGVSCQRCDRVICGECQNQASVGFHCPECKKSSKQKVYSANSLPGQNAVVTKALIGINVVVFIITIVFLGATANSIGAAGADFGTFGPFIAEENEFWRIITGAFLHSGVLHIAFNMYLLWQLGQQLERALGAKAYLAVYFATLLGGSFGALLLDPVRPVVGASGAVFGLIGFTVLFYRSRGIGLFDTGLGFLIVINGIFSLRGGVSLGGHLGGFLAGLALGAIFYGINAGDGPLIGDSKQRLAAVLGISVALIAASIWAASTWMAPIF